MKRCAEKHEHHMPDPVRRGFAALMLAAAGTLAQAQMREPSPITAVRLQPGETLRLDGSLSHPAWRRAPVFLDFTTKDPEFGQAPAYETRVQVLYDERAVYVGVTALDPKPELIRDPPVRHDAVLRTQDFVVLYLDPIGKKQSAQWFRVSAAGSTSDGMSTAADDSEDFAPDFDFDARVQRSADGYTVVYRVPFASLRYTREAGRNWRIMVARRVPREQFHLLTSVPIPHDAPSFLANMQELRGLESPQASHFLTVRPSATLRRTRAQEVPAAVATEIRVQPTLDIKWRPTPELVIDGTIKPDFSQVDLDVPQLGGNTQFALNFPEKRPFFFEASDVLRSPTEALYTRSFTQPRWGLRATWRGMEHAGTAIAIGDEGGGLVLLPGPYSTGIVAQPSSRTLAVRELADVGPLGLGAVLAARRYGEGMGSNIVAGPDLGWQVNETLRLRAQWLRSRTTALPDATGTRLQEGPALEGDRIYLKAVNQTGFQQADVALNDVGAGFRHDTGFVNQSGIRSVEAHYGRALRQWGAFNEFWFNFNANYTRDRQTGETIKVDPFAGIWFAAARNTQASLEMHALSRVRAAPGAPLLHEKYLYGTYVTSPAASVPLLDSSLAIGQLADMIANVVRPGARLNLSVRARPLKHLELEPRVSYAMLQRDGKATYREAALQLKAIWFLDATSDLRLILQRTVLDRLPEAGVAQEHSRGKVASLTYTWRKSMGTVLYAGASYSKGRFPLPQLTRGSEAFVKVQFDYDEVRGGLF
jgi:hypothetical protein